MRKHAEQAMLNLLKHTEIALGSNTSIVLVFDAKDEANAAELMKKIWLMIFGFERQFSRFLPNSELSQFNRVAGPKIKISPEFKQLLQASLIMSKKTSGLYNPFILPALQRAGYKKSQVSKYQNADVDDYSQLTVVKPDKLIVGDDWASIPHGTAIDMGGCGKGYLADQLADIIEGESWIKGYWVSLGGDISGGGVDENNEPWKIYISDDEIDDLSDKPYFLSDGDRFAVATSGLNFRKGIHNGKKWHHIIDPTTLKPVQTDLQRISLFGKSCLDCDVFASVCLILGQNKAIDFIKSRDEIESAILKPIKVGKETPSLKYYGMNITKPKAKEVSTHA